jgi:hypothetical protein
MDSAECAKIHENAYFARTCAQIVRLRRELAAAEDYERLSARAAELRKGLAMAPIVATTDPLPAAFSATLGRILPLSGTEGVATLVTLVIETMSCFGLAGLTALSNGRGAIEDTPREAHDAVGGTTANNLPLAHLSEAAQILRLPIAREPQLVCPPTPSEGRPRFAQPSTEQGFGQTIGKDLGRGFGQTRPTRTQRPEAAMTRLARGSASGGASRVNYQAAEKAVQEFVALLERDKDARATGSELASAYGAQRALRGWPDLKPNVFGMHLKSAVATVGGRKIKSGSQIYQGVRVPAVAGAMRL